MADTSAYVLLSGEGLPADARVRRYRAHEQLSHPFDVEVHFQSEDADFDVSTLLRKSLLVTLVDALDRTRSFHGVVDVAEFVDAYGDELQFRVVLRPALQALAYRENSKIWQFKAVPDVLKDVFAGAGIPADKIEWRTFNDYEPREFCVQYRESELAFVSRLMEDEGIFYFFRHSADGHVMVIGDDPDAFQDSPEAPAALLSFTDSTDAIADFSRTRALRTGSVILRDYDFEKPQQFPMAVNQAGEKWRMPFYEYPGGFVKSDAGKRRAAARLSERRRDADTCRGESSAIGLRVGVPFKLEGAEPTWMNGDYVCTELTTFGEQAGADGDAGSNVVCRNVFAGIVKGAPFAPARITPKPRIRGIQTAVVTGSSDEAESIHCDKYGRIKVRFHWDRVGPNDHNSSCWLRAQQIATGGSIILPRVGWELAIAFVDGDPDRPLALGRIYNGEQMVPYPLPGASASGSLKSMSAPGGAGHNEIKLSDTAGSQGAGITAQKDFNVTVGNNKTEAIAVNEEHNVTANMQTNVGGDESIEVGATQDVTIGAQLSHKISGDQTITVGGMEIDAATANYVEKVGGDRAYTVSGAMITICNGIQTAAKAGITRNVGAVEVKGAVGAISTHVGGAFTENVAAVKLELVKGVSSEAIGGMKMQQSAAAEVHLVDGNHASSSKASITNLIGGLHWQNVVGAYSVKAPMITLLGATGDFKGGATELKMGSSGLSFTGSKLAIKTALLVKMGSSLKMGSG